MGLLSRGSDLVASAADWRDILTPAPRPVYTIGAADVSGLIGGSFGLDTAMMVPAFARGMDVIAGQLSGLPLVDMDPATGTLLTPQGLTARPTMSPGLPNATLMRRTATELVAYARAYWRVTAVDGLGWPTAVEFLTNDRVTQDGSGWLVDGVRAPRTGVGRIIAFDTGGSGALEHGWLAIRTALSLESAANNYASSPVPSLALQSVGLDLDTDEAKELISEWELARKRNSTAYLNSQVKVETFGFSAAELQLIEARQHAAIEIARILNLDPYWVGASPQGSSQTYNNEQDRRAALLDFTILPIARVIEQRLSLPDVTGTGRVVRFNTMGFLRANLGERVAAFTAYVAAGVLTVDEARALEPLVKVGETPA